MLAVFTKPLELVTPADIADLAARTWPEGYEVEFKEALPHNTGGIDPWLTGRGHIGNYARDEILAEIIALANSQGGTVILGVAETPDNPPRASAIVPLPRVSDLALRFEDQARSCIDPPLPRLQIRAIETDEHGGGVVIFRTLPSRAAPHRLTTTRESYVRRGSSTVKMTMREIQDMTLNVARGLSGIDASFAQRRAAFHDWANKETHVVAYRVTALPLVELPDPGRLFGQKGVFPEPSVVKAKAESIAVDLDAPIHDYNERPRLRGVTRSGEHFAGAFLWELHQTGLTDLWISVRPWKPSGTGGQAEFVLYHAEVLGAVANSLLVIRHYREHMGAPDAEYAFEVEVREFRDFEKLLRAEGKLLGPPMLPIYKGFFAANSMDQYNISKVSLLLPRLSVGSPSEFANLVSTVGVDLYDALGIRQVTPPRLEVNF